MAEWGWGLTHQPAGMVTAAAIVGLGLRTLLTSLKLGRHFGVEGRGFQQRRRQDVADAGYRDVLVPVLETSALGRHRRVALESDLCVNWQRTRLGAEIPHDSSPEGLPHSRTISARPPPGPGVSGFSSSAGANRFHRGWKSSPPCWRRR